MRIRKHLAALLALGLLLGLCPAAVTEDIGDEITSAAVELAVPEDELSLGGAPEDAGCAGFVGDIAVAPAEGDIPVDAEHFTYSEDGFCFLDYVQANIDTDGDGVLSEAERLAVVEIRFGVDDGPEALDGLQYFPNLEVLNVNQRGKKPGLSRLDVSHNTKLKFLGVNWNSIESLDLSKNTALEELNYYRGGLAETLDLTACTALKVVDCDRNICLRNLILGDKPNLEKLECDECSLTELDLSGCPNLVTCYCSGNALTKLNINGCSRLKTLDCASNPALKELDICDCVATLKTFNHNADLLVIIARPTATPTAKPTATPAPVSLEKAKITVKAQTYTGKALKPAVKVKLGGKALEAGTDYAVEYEGNRKIGTATVKVTGVGAYTGTASAAFKINPKKVAGLSLKAGRKALTVAWKKASGVDGYQIQYGMKKDFSDAVKRTVKGAGTLWTTLKRLKASKTWYVRVRAYKKVDGKTCYSDWSAVKSKKTK